MITIVIPTLNEEANVSKLLPSVKRELKGEKFEILIVDGCSSDRTVEIAKKQGARVITDNIGKGSALIKGFRESKGDIIVSMDADLSHEPKELRLLISGIEAGYDVCTGSRFLSGGGTADMPLFRVFGNRCFVTMVNLFYGSHYTDMCYGYRSFSRNALKKMHLIENGFGIETEINIKAQKAGLKVLEVPSYEKKREHGEGKLHSFRDGWIILTTIFKNLG